MQIRRAYADTREGQIHYRIAGSGDPLLLLHQIGQASDQWLQVFPALAAHHRVIAVDIIGYGSSDLPRPGYTTADYARATFHFLDALGIARTSIVGARFGGSIAVEMAAQDPGRVDKLVVSTCSHLDPSARDQKGSDPKYRPMKIESDGSHLLKQWKRSTNVGEGLGPELTQKFVAMYLRSDYGLRAEDGHDALYSYDIQERLPLVKSPTLLIYGTGDEYYARREVTRKLIPRSRIKVIEGTGSLAMYDKPDAYAAAVLEFLENPAV